MHGDFRRAVETCGDAAGSGAGRSVAVQSVMRPGADELGGRTTSVADEGDPAGQADLSAVGVAGEHEVESVMPRVFKSFRAVGKQDRTGALRYSASRGLQIVRAVKVRIVDPSEPELFAVAFDGGILVEQDAKSGFLEMGNDFDDVMVAEHGEGAGSEGAGDPPDVAEAIVEVSGRMISEVPRDDGEVVRGVCDEIDQTVGESFHAIEMKIGKMEQTETVEGGREVGEGLVAGDGFDAQAVGAAAGGETGEAEEAGDEVVDRDDTFDGERAFALVDEAGAEVGLAVETLAEERWTEARGHGVEVGVFDVL